MRICIIREYFFPDMTGPTVMSDLARALADQHHLDIDVITSRNSYGDPTQSYEPFTDWDGIQITRLASPHTKRPSTMLRLLAGVLFTINAFLTLMLRRRKYDVLCALSCPPMLPAAIRLYSRLSGIPYIYIVSDLYPDIAVSQQVLSEHGLVTRLCQRLQRGWLHAARRVIVIGRCMRDYLVKTYGLRPEQIAVIPNFANPDEIVPLSRETQFRRGHDLHGFTVLLTGNLGPNQRYDEFLTAAELLKETHPTIRFLIVGAGARSAYLADEIAGRRLTNMSLHPPVSRDMLSDLLATADVTFVSLEPWVVGLGVPSRFYSFLASGRPVLGLLPRSAEVACAIDEHHCGRTVNYDQPEELARTIAALAEAPETVASMGHNAREALLEHYTLARIAEQYARVLHDCANSHVETNRASQ